jgi:hypothetical protein
MASENWADVLKGASKGDSNTTNIIASRTYKAAMERNLERKLFQTSLSGDGVSS